MGLIERIMGVEEEVYGPKIPVHAFSALMRERARGFLNNTSAQLAVDSIAEPLRTAPDVNGRTDTAEALALVNSITGAGNAQQQLNRATLIDDVLLLAENGRAEDYATPTRVRTRLGLT